MSAYFYKELPDRPVVINKRSFKFDFIKLDDDESIALLRSAVRNKVGGVREISAEEFEGRIKKKQSLKSYKPQRSPSGQRQELKAGMVRPRVSQGRAVAVAEASPVAPVGEVPINERGLPDFTAFLPKIEKAGGGF